jgi:hypothetical protein
MRNKLLYISQNSPPVMEKNLERLKIVVNSISDKSDKDVFVFIAPIDYATVDAFIKILRSNKQKKTNCAVILTTNGGDPDAAYRMSRSIQKYYTKFTLYVFGMCKSAGTLIALAADEIIMSDFGELGPLDIQLAKDDELQNTSGLNYLQSLSSLNESIFKSFEENFLKLKSKSSNTITTRTAAEISSKLAIGIIAPISEQIDPVKLGEVVRAILIADKYGSRLMRNRAPIATRNLIVKLITDYPSHEFVIDFKEVEEIFGKDHAKWVNEEEAEMEQILLDMCRSQPLPNQLDGKVPAIIQQLNGKAAVAEPVVKKPVGKRKGKSVILPKISAKIEDIKISSKKSKNGTTVK